MHGRNRTDVSLRHDEFSALSPRHHVPPLSYMHVMSSKQLASTASSPHLHRQSYANISLSPNFSAYFFTFSSTFLHHIRLRYPYNASFRTPPFDFSPVKFSETRPEYHFLNIYNPKTHLFCPKISPDHPKMSPPAPKFDLLTTL